MINEAFNVASNPKYPRYQTGLASMLYDLFNKKKQETAETRTNCNLDSDNKKLVEELHKPLIRKFTRRKIY